MTCKRKQETDVQVFVGLEDNLSNDPVFLTIKSSCNKPFYNYTLVMICDVMLCNCVAHGSAAMSL